MMRLFVSLFGITFNVTVIAALWNAANISIPTGIFGIANLAMIPLNVTFAIIAIIDLAKGKIK